MAERKNWGRSLGSEWGNIPSMGSVTGSIIRDVLRMGGEGTETSGSTQSTPNVAIKKTRKERLTPYTAEQIAADPALAALKRGITYQDALANYRKLTKVLNMSQLAGSNNDKSQQKRYEKAYAALTPEQRAAERIFFAMGGSLESTNPKYGGYGLGSVNTDLFNKLGIDATSIPKYSPVKFGVRTPSNRVEFNLQNPLSQQQRSRLQRLRTLSSTGKLSAKQKAALSRLKSKKNAPTILP